jgi:hypothetical protein
MLRSTALVVSVSGCPVLPSWKVAVSVNFVRPQDDDETRPLLDVWLTVLS